MNPSHLLSSIAQQYERILGQNLVGIYTHGSIGFGCFNWDRSDIDFIVVISTPLTSQEKQQLLSVLIEAIPQAPPKGFEMSVVLKEHCRDFVYPTPYQLHYGNDWLDGYKENPQSLLSTEAKTDPDLAAHFTVIKHAGIVTHGAPIPEVFGHIPKEHYLDSIVKDIENAQEHIHDSTVYITLNLCRVYAYIKDGAVISKKTGGEWGLAHLPKKYHGLITQALDNYVSGAKLEADNALKSDFAKHMLSLIHPAASQ